MGKHGQVCPPTERYVKHVCRLFCSAPVIMRTAQDPLSQAPYHANAPWYSKD